MGLRQTLFLKLARVIILIFERKIEIKHLDFNSILRDIFMPFYIAMGGVGILSLLLALILFKGFIIIFAVSFLSASFAFLFLSEVDEDCLIEFSMLFRDKFYRDRVLLAGILYYFEDDLIHQYEDGKYVRDGDCYRHKDNPDLHFWKRSFNKYQTFLSKLRLKGFDIDDKKIKYLSDRDMLDEIELQKNRLIEREREIIRNIKKGDYSTEYTEELEFEEILKIENN